MVGDIAYRVIYLDDTKRRTFGARTKALDLVSAPARGARVLRSAGTIATKVALRVVALGRVYRRNPVTMIRQLPLGAPGPLEAGLKPAASSRRRRPLRRHRKLEMDREEG